MLEFFSSSNDVVNTRRAVDECLENALSPEDTGCDLILFHTTVGHDYGELLDEMHRLAPSARIVGCTGAGVIGSEGAFETPRALAALAVRGPEFAVSGLESIVGTDPYDVGVKIASDLAEQQADTNIVCIFTSAFEVYPADRLIAGVESVFGSEVVIVGGCAHDNGYLVSNWQFLDTRVFERGTVAVGFSDPSIEVVIRSDHGHDTIGEPFEVSKSEGHRVYELEGIQAWKFITGRAGLEVTVDPKSPLASGIWGLALELPEDLRKPYGGDYSIHMASLSLQPDGSILAGVTCPVGSKMWIAGRNERQIMEGTDRTVEEIRSAAGGRNLLTVFDSDCAIRGHFMFNRFLKEEIVFRMQRPLYREDGSPPPWLGFYSAGEFCRVGNRNWFHSFTMTLAALFRKSA